MYDIPDIGFVTCNRSVIVFVDPIPELLGAKFVSRKVLGFDTENVELQFMYGCSDNEVIFANITIDMVI